MFGLLPAGPGDGPSVVGFSIFGNVTGNLTQTVVSGAAAPQEPVLVWNDPPADPNDTFGLLSWSVRLTGLIGRQQERDSLTEWVNGPRQPRVRLISGPGGAGKTRLAAELAKDLRDARWTAGFWRLDRPGIFSLRPGGLLLVLDYPEQHRDAVRSLLADLAAVEEPVAPIRVLLLSRRPLAWWEDVIDAAHAGLLVDKQQLGLEQLAEADAVKLLQATVRALADYYQRNVPVPDSTAVGAWLARNPSVHGLGLFIRAAALQTLLDGQNNLGLGAQAIIEALVRRERQRLSGISNAFGLGSDGLPRLLALATIAGGLDASRLKSLARPKLQLDLPRPTHIVGAVSRTPMWHEKMLPAQTPDILGAELLVQCLNQRLDMAPEWLWAAIHGAGPELVERLARIVHDLGTLGSGKQRPLQDALLNMLRTHPKRAEALAFVANQELPSGLSELGAMVAAAKVASSQDIAERAGWLTNLSSHLAEAGNRRDALTAIKGAVEVFRQLAKLNVAAFASNLANALNNLSFRLAETGERQSALKAIKEAEAIFRKLAGHDPDAYEPGFAVSLNSLSIRLAEVGDREGALAAAREAVTIRRRLAARDLPQFELYLGTSLMTLSNRLVELGLEDEALRALDEAIEIWSRLAEYSPARFESDLAASLGNLSNILGRQGDSAGALNAIDRAVTIWRRLTHQSPSRFEPDFVTSLNTQAVRHRDAGELELPLDAIQEAVTISRRLVAENPAWFRPKLAMALHTLSTCLADHGDQPQALAAIDEAVAIYRQLVRENPAGFESDLAGSLNNQSSRLAECGAARQAVAAIDEAVAIYRRMAQRNPARFESDFASTLHNASLRFHEIGDEPQALKAIMEAVAIRRLLEARDPGRFEPDLVSSLSVLLELVEDDVTKSDVENEIARHSVAGLKPDSGVIGARPAAEKGPDPPVRDLPTSRDKTGTARSWLTQWWPGLRILGP